MEKIRNCVRVCVLAFFVATTPLEAAVPLSTIKKWQDSATEALELTVLSVNKSTRAGQAIGDQFPGCTQTFTDQTVTAKVDVVHRSAGGLQPGDVIVFDNTFMYVSPLSCIVPGYPMGETFNPGDRAEAYLRPAEKGDRKFVPNYVNKLR
jgi:hypothetical protein